MIYATLLMQSLIFGLFTVCGCKDAPTEQVQLYPAGGISSSVSIPTSAQREEQECRAQIDRWNTLPALPGAPGFEAKRRELLGRAKGEPIVFLRAPRFEQELPLRLSLLREEMRRKSPYLGIPKVMEQLRYFPSDLRRIFLAEGYVYSESPAEAAVLIDVLKLGRLFREPELWLARGGETLQVLRDRYGTYRYAGGAQKGEEASLLFGDRVAIQASELVPRLHRDLTTLVDKYHVDQVRLDRLTEQGAVAALRFGEHWVPAALKEDGKRYDLSCMAIPASQRSEILSQQSANALRAGSIARLKNAIHQMVDERLRFDEPLEEVGQQDGSLRPVWQWAYLHDATTYSFNGVGYRVFDNKGRPHPPQVCIDFVLDVYERAGGGWFQDVNQPRQRTQGTIHLDELDLRNRRSVAEFVSFAEKHPEIFEVWSLPEEERIPFARRQDFFAYIERHSARFREGNIVAIHGLKDDGLPHHHSFLIEAEDPITNFPFRLAGNAGRPRIQSWEGVMRSAPRRSIRHTIQPQATWLKEVLPPQVTPPASSSVPPDSQD